MLRITNDHLPDTLNQRAEPLAVTVRRPDPWARRHDNIGTE
nr:hypothetical protein [Sphingomonas laterariae]